MGSCAAAARHLAVRHLAAAGRASCPATHIYLAIVHADTDVYCNPTLVTTSSTR